jgi:hypothetical protein
MHTHHDTDYMHSNITQASQKSYYNSRRLPTTQISDYNKHQTDSDERDYGSKSNKNNDQDPNLEDYNNNTLHQGS